MADNERRKTLIYDDLLAEGMHVAFRKASDHPIAHKIWVLIRDLPDEEWGRIVAFIRDGASVPEGADG